MVKKALILEETLEKEKLKCTCEDKSMRIEEANSGSTDNTLNEKL